MPVVNLVVVMAVAAPPAPPAFGLTPLPPAPPLPPVAYAVLVGSVFDPVFAVAAPPGPPGEPVIPLGMPAVPVIFMTSAWPAGAPAMSANGRAVVANSRFANAEENDMGVVPSQNSGARWNAKTRPPSPPKFTIVNTKCVGCL